MGVKRLARHCIFTSKHLVVSWNALSTAFREIQCSIKFGILHVQPCLYIKVVIDVNLPHRKEVYAFRHVRCSAHTLDRNLPRAKKY